MQWAHPRASAAPPRKAMGPNEAIGDSCSKSNGPILGHWWQLTKKGMGPCEAIGNGCSRCSGPMLWDRQHLQKSNGPMLQHRQLLLEKSNGPKRSHWQQLLQMQWTHPRASAAPLRKAMGPNEAIGDSCSKCSGPILGHRQLAEK